MVSRSSELPCCEKYGISVPRLMLSPRGVGWPLNIVIPAKSGIHASQSAMPVQWIPAFAGVPYRDLLPRSRGHVS